MERSHGQAVSVTPDAADRGGGKPQSDTRARRLAGWARTNHRSPKHVQSGGRSAEDAHRQTGTGSSWAGPVATGGPAAAGRGAGRPHSRRHSAEARPTPAGHTVSRGHAAASGRPPSAGDAPHRAVSGSWQKDCPSDGWEAPAERGSPAAPCLGRCRRAHDLGDTVPWRAGRRPQLEESPGQRPKPTQHGAASSRRGPLGDTSPPASLRRGSWQAVGRLRPPGAGVAVPNAPCGAGREAPSSAALRWPCGAGASWRHLSAVSFHVHVAFDP